MQIKDYADAELFAGVVVRAVARQLTRTGMPPWVLNHLHRNKRHVQEGTAAHLLLCARELGDIPALDMARKLRDLTASTVAETAVLTRAWKY
jgi:hypothetical protein